MLQHNNIFNISIIVHSKLHDCCFCYQLIWVHIYFFTKCLKHCMLSMDLKIVCMIIGGKGIFSHNTIQHADTVEKEL